MRRLAPLLLLPLLWTGCGTDPETDEPEPEAVIENCPVTPEQLKAATGVEWTSDVAQDTRFSVLQGIDHDACRFASKAWGATDIPNAIFLAAVATGDEAAKLTKAFDDACLERHEGIEPDTLTRRKTNALCQDNTFGHRSFRYGTDPAHLLVFEYVNPDRIDDAGKALDKLAKRRH